MAPFDVPQHVVAAGELRKAYINLGELLAAPVTGVIAPELLRGRDILWFIDNKSALSQLIRRTSSAADASQLAAVHSLTMAALGTRVWYEWVPSKTNPADVLSREAWDSPEVQLKLASGEWVRLSGVVPWPRLLTVDYTSIWEMFAALGIDA